MFGCRSFLLVIGLLLVQIATGRADTPSAEASDPPDAVGRIAVMSGTVLFRADGTQASAPALLNYPLSLGNVVETLPRAHATIDVAAGRFYLDGRTRLRIGILRDGSSAVALEQGALVLHVLKGGDGQVFSVETGKGTLRVDQPGYYEVEAGEGDQPTTVSAMEGGAQFRTADQREQVLHPRERIVVGNTLERGEAVEDDLIRRVAAEIESIGENNAAAPDYVSPQITGFQDLTRYGMWVLTDGYGPVWEPQVGEGWAPYSRGKWVDVAPWGKTWIDDAPWGFAPFHYGRWVKLSEERWAWLPGEMNTAPVYAPALVSFFDTPNDQDGPRRWIPLGPEEPYLPPYQVSIVYFRQINAPALPPVVNIKVVNNIVQITNVVKIVKRRPVLILDRLVNRPGAPVPIPMPRSIPTMTVSQGSISVHAQPAPTWHPIISETRMQQQGSVVIVAPTPSSPVPSNAPSNPWSIEPGFQVTPQPADQPIVVLRNQPVAPSGGGTTPSPPVVTRTVPSTSGVTLGTVPTPPTVTFGQSPGANSVTMP